jgi:hypothetical protein
MPIADSKSQESKPRSIYILEAEARTRCDRFAQRITDGRVLRLIKAMLKAGSYGKGSLVARRDWYFWKIEVAEDRT